MQTLLARPQLQGGAQDEAAAPQEVAANAPVRLDSSALVRKLTSRDAPERQHAAEELAHLAAVEQRRLVEGYRMQEKNERVRVALDWALYRMGKRDALYNLVRALDSARADQAQVYLSGLEGPDALYPFLERVNGNTQIQLLQVLAHIGDAQTLERIKPLTLSLDPKIADAARAATSDITQRLADAPATPTSPRQRQVGQQTDDDAETQPPPAEVPTP
ncbi:MAG TPA: hypothetical protein VNA19_06130 [Pyrinomonadaceae bacterium]|nr:hypothetical protein [Pyrinomonadaceae bacterium]